MKLKRLLAGVLTGIMVVGLASESWKSCVNEVQAAENNLPSKEDEWLVDKYGLKYRFISKFNGDSNSVIANNDSLSAAAGDVQRIFDGDNTTGVILRNSYGNYGGANKTGDYVGVLFKQAVNVNSIEFVFAAAQNDSYASSKFQYTTDGTTWTDVDGATFEDVQTMTHSFGDDSQSVKGIRLTATSDKNDKWLRLNEISFDTDFRPEVTVGTFQDNDTAAQKAIDGDFGTKWHSNYSSDNYRIEKYWYDLEVPELTSVEGIKLAHNTDSQWNNGRILGYEVWVSSKEDVSEPLTDDMASEYGGTSTEAWREAYAKSWQKDYTKVCEGTWKDSRDQTMNMATFGKQEVRHIRVVAKRTVSDGHDDNKFATISEICFVPVTTNTYADLEGGSLRMDLPNDFTKTFLRFEYKIPQTLGNGMTVDTAEDKLWGWKYGVKDAADVENKTTVAKVENGKYRLDSDDGCYYSNAVFKNIGKDNFSRSVYIQLVVNYKNQENELLTIYSSVSDRSVQTVAEKIVEAYTGNADKVEQLEYAKGILGYDAQLAGGNNDFAGGKIKLEDCLHTFTKTNEDNTYVISAKSTDAVYLNLTSGLCPHNAEARNIEVRNGETEGTFKLYDKEQSSHLHFWASPNTKGDRTFDRCGTSCGTNDEFEIYKPSTSVTSDIEGYEKVTALSDLENGVYLIVSKSTADDNYYALRPVISNNKYDHVAKVLK